MDDITIVAWLEDENGKIHYVTDVVAERVTFLSTNKKHEITNESHDER